MNGGTILGIASVAVVAGVVVAVAGTVCLLALSGGGEAQAPASNVDVSAPAPAGAQPGGARVPVVEQPRDLGASASGVEEPESDTSSGQQRTRPVAVMVPAARE